MQTRKEKKKKTRQKLLAIAKQVFIDKGWLQSSTVDIAEKAGVAHGTVFFHFKNKENLIIEVLDTELLKITDELNDLLHGPHSFENLLNKYLSFLEKEEALFSIIARETPFYPPELRRIILGREAAIRSYFYNTLQDEIDSGSYKNIDITSALIFLFGTINYYLSMRNVFTAEKSVIKEKRALIIQTFHQMLTA